MWSILLAFTITMSKSIGNLSYVLPYLQQRRNHCIYFCLAMMQKVLNVLSSWQKIFWIQLVPSLVHLGNQILVMLVYKINWGLCQNKTLFSSCIAFIRYSYLSIFLESPIHLVIVLIVSMSALFHVKLKLSYIYILHACLSLFIQNSLALK